MFRRNGRTEDSTGTTGQEFMVAASWIPVPFLLIMEDTVKTGMPELSKLSGLFCAV
jgi:hypothetical protein